jgi:hypothetical protein
VRNRFVPTHSFILSLTLALAMPSFSISLDEEEYSELVKLAKKEKKGTTVNQFAAQCVRAFLPGADRR